MFSAFKSHKIAYKIIENKVWKKVQWIYSGHRLVLRENFRWYTQLKYVFCTKHAVILTGTMKPAEILGHSFCFVPNRTMSCIAAVFNLRNVWWVMIGLWRWICPFPSNLLLFLFKRTYHFLSSFLPWTKFYFYTFLFILIYIYYISYFYIFYLFLFIYKKRIYFDYNIQLAMASATQKQWQQYFTEILPMVHYLTVGH